MKGTDASNISDDQTKPKDPFSTSKLPGKQSGDLLTAMMKEDKSTTTRRQVVDVIVSLRSLSECFEDSMETVGLLSSTTNIGDKRTIQQDSVFYNQPKIMSRLSTAFSPLKGSSTDSGQIPNVISSDGKHSYCLTSDKLLELEKVRASARREALPITDEALRYSRGTVVGMLQDSVEQIVNKKVDEWLAERFKNLGSAV
jgi:hypothetical protein